MENIVARAKEGEMKGGRFRSRDVSIEWSTVYVPLACFPNVDWKIEGQYELELFICGGRGFSKI